MVAAIHADADAATEGSTTATTFLNFPKEDASTSKNALSFKET
jgi:hypothetical protein